MHVFIKSNYRLAKTSFETRVTYSGCLVLLFGGIGTQLALGLGRVGLTPAAVATYYRGGEGELSFPKAWSQLLEEAHFHLFSIPVVLLLLLHLLFATGCPPRLRLAIAGACWLGALVEVAGPFAVRYLGAGFALLLMAGWLLLAAGMAATAGFSLWALWARESGPAPASEP